jgi:hypothetical protein
MIEAPTARTNRLGMTATGRSIASLLILIHLFAVVVSLLGNESASALRVRLAGVLAPYTRLLNLDPEFTAGYHLTHAMEYEDDHQLMIEMDGRDTPLLYPPPSRAIKDFLPGFHELRCRWLAQRLGILAFDQNDDAVAELARAIGQAVFAENESRHFVFTCRRIRPLELEGDADRSLDDDASYEPLYRADIIRDSQGVVRIHKRVETGEAAPVQGTD